jgi:hypothetical protein
VLLLAGSTSRYRPWPQFIDHRQDATKQVMGDRHLSHLEDRIAGVSDHPFKINPHHLTPGPYT